MCQLCGDTGAKSHGISYTERPAHVLGGIPWIGTVNEAGEGALNSLICMVRDFSAARNALWKSPIVGLALNLRDHGFDYFVGIAVEEGDRLPDGFIRLPAPELMFASSWHSTGDGEIADHYRAMVDWLARDGRVRNTAFCQHREEYPHDIDLSDRPSYRLMVPIEPGRI